MALGKVVFVEVMSHGFDHLDRDDAVITSPGFTIIFEPELNAIGESPLGHTLTGLAKLVLRKRK